MKTIAFSCFAALFALLCATPALAQASGSALGVKTDANATRENQTRQLVVGADIFIGDRVQTDARGLVQIKFSDQTELVVGPNSALVIDDYLLRADNSAGKFAVNALAGTFRFVTGQAPKDRYQITTPTGTIGVRGTEFDMVVTPGDTEVLLYGGAVQMCSTGGGCVELTDVCELGTFDAREAQSQGHTDTITGAARDALRGSFIYAVNQQPLMREFWLPSANRCANRPPDGGVTGGNAVLGGEESPDAGRKYPDPCYECDSIEYP